MMGPIMAHDDAPLPSSIDEVEGLISRLYNPQTSPVEVQRINKLLQKLQRSQDGWFLATSLSSSSNEHTQFFAASTYMVKLNTDWQSLSEVDALGLLDTLISWLMKVVAADFPPYIWRKICVALVTYYIRFPSLWQQCIRHLVCRFSGGIVGTQQIGLDVLPPTETILGQLSQKVKLVTVAFVRTLVEEIGKIDSKNVKGSFYHEGMGINASEAARVVMIILTEYGSPVNQLAIDQAILIQEGFSCYQSWAVYAARELGAALQPFQPLTKVVIQWFESEMEMIYLVAMTTVTEVLTSGPTFFRMEDNTYLAECISGSWGQERYNECVPTEDTFYQAEEVDTFSQMLIAFAEANLATLVRNIESPTSQMIFEMLHGFLKAPGYAVVDEQCSSLQFEFWSALTEYIADEVSEEDQRTLWVALSKDHLLRAVQEYCVKIKIPPPQVLVGWAKDDQNEFRSYRKDFADLLEISYPVLQSGLFAELVQHVLKQLQKPQPDWQEVESCLFCINTLSNSLTDSPMEYSQLSELLQSPLFHILANNQSPELSRTKLSAISIIGSYSEYFEQNSDLLPSSLNFLFSSLTLPKLIPQASKSIFSLCSTCRSKLVSELPAFMQHYQHYIIFAASSSVDSIGRERVIGALGCLIECIKSEEDKATALQPLLVSIFSDLETCQRLLASQNEEEAKEKALLALKCLVSLGKALQAPEDIVVVLDDEQNSSQPSTCWDTGNGRNIQIAICTAIEDVAKSFSYDREVIKEACDVFRCGFTETSPGLLVFPTNAVVNFLLQCGSRSPFYDITLGTASAFINCIPKSESDECRRLTSYVLGLLVQLPSPEHDPELAYNILEYADRLLTKYLSLFLNVEEFTLSSLFSLALASLVCKEQFPKKTACTFWANLITIANGGDEQRMIDLIMQNTGEALAKNLIMAIGGGASRSELDNIAEPLKKLVFKQIQARKWLQAGLFSHGEDFPSPKVSSTDKTRFLSKLFTLRGGRGTNQLVKEFWLACRGTDFAYAS